MVAAQWHRGPDDAGIELVASATAACWLGCSRLAIIDLSSAGHMPMQDAASSNWIVYNGEIYNFPHLRTQLATCGERFASRTDTEVILCLYRRYGARTLDRLRGMFAFAIWDADRGELFLARDRSAKKPLYYLTGTDGTFAFASEVRALVASGLVEPRLDPRALDVYLANGFLISPLTLLRGVRSLLPGHCMRVASDGRILEQTPYWHPPSPATGHPENLDGRIEALRDLFRESVELRLISDVPLGIFLSGGLDSSGILSTCNRIGGNLRTFSVTLPGQGFDESASSRQVASVWSSKHSEVPIDEDQFWKWLPGALTSLDQPSFDGINTYLVSRAAREAGLKTALSGLGADELFGGYPFFLTMPFIRAFAHLARNIPSRFRASLGRLAGDGHDGLLDLAGPRKVLDLLGWVNGPHELSQDVAIAAYQVVQTLFPSWARRSLLEEPPDYSRDHTGWSRLGLPDEFAALLKTDLSGSDPTGALSLLTWRLFLGERCLRDTDAMSMGVSLEVRAPFTDHVFVDQVLRLPGRLRCAGAPDKPFELKLLESFFEGQWPRRRKRGFILPFHRWLAEPPGNTIVKETLNDESAARAAGLRPRSVHALWEAHRARPDRVPWSRVWAVFVLIDWCRRHGASP